MPHGGVDRLLDAVDVRGEGGDDELLGGLVEGLLDGRGEVALGTHESGHFGVGGVDHEDVDPLLTELGEGPQVGDPPVDGQLVHLEVTGVEDRPGVGLDVDGQRVGDGVVDGDELDVELLADLGGVALTHHAQVVVADAVLLELGLHQGKGEFGSVDRDVRTTLEQERHRTDVVLVAVGQQQGLDSRQLVVVEVVQVRQEQIDAGMVVLGEQDAAVDEQQFPVDLVAGHVAADVAQPSQRDDA